MAVLLAERVAAQAGQREVGAVLLDRVEQSAQGVTRDSLIITLRQRVQILLNGGLGGCLRSAQCGPTHRRRATPEQLR